MPQAPPFEGGGGERGREQNPCMSNIGNMCGVKREVFWPFWSENMSNSKKTNFDQFAPK